jgi:imidazolonepropionase-like amidohydrolase
MTFGTSVLDACPATFREQDFIPLAEKRYLTMKIRALSVALALVFGTVSIFGQTSKLSPTVREFISVDAPVVALAHVRVIDGTGGAPLEDQVVIVADGKIRSLGPFAGTKIPADAKVLDLTGKSVIPGLVGMHEHLFYVAGLDLRTGRITFRSQPFSFPRLYLAAGATTIRTAGTLDPFRDLNVKKDIDRGASPGPKIHLTAPYLEGGPVPAIPDMIDLGTPENVAKTVNYWADQGFTSFKAYVNLNRAQLRAAVEAAHKRGLKITGHLCAVTYGEAADIGIDNLEHGFFAATDFQPGKAPDQCPPPIGGNSTLTAKSPEVQALIKKLVERKVALTSTLPVFEEGPGTPPIQRRVLDAMSVSSKASCLDYHSLLHDARFKFLDEALAREYAFEREFVAAGGLLLAGSDPTGSGCVVAGFGTQRQVELLVLAGFTPVEAIRIATYNGALFLGEADRIGTIAAEKQADLVVVNGNPARNIEDIENVETVFKDGIGYDSQKLIASVRGQVGER